MRFLKRINNMKSTISDKQQTELLKAQALNRLSRTALADRLNLSRSSIIRVLDSNIPIPVSKKVFTAVNNFLIEELSNK